jgi:hypothetical protein
MAFAQFRAWFPNFDADDLVLRSWAAETSRLSEGEFALGVERTKQDGGQFAPSLPKFLSLCKPETGSPRYLGANPINVTEARIAGLLPQPEKKQFDMEALRKCLRG